MSIESRRGEFEHPPLFTINLDETELVIGWFNSVIRRYKNSLLDHLLIVNEDREYAAFPTVNNADILTILENHAWEVDVDRFHNPPDIIELAEMQLIGEIMALEQDM